MSQGIDRRKLLQGAAGVSAIALAAPALLRSAWAQGSGPIKIGFPVPLTGAFGAEANDQVRAAQIAVKEFNETGGFEGRMAELLVRDDKLNPGEAATRTLELIEKDKVNFIVGALSAAVTLSINNVARERGVIYNSISQSDAINEAKDFGRTTFHEALNPHMTAGAVGRYVFPKASGKKVAFLTADYAYGHEMVRGFRKAGEASGIEVVADIRHPIGASDYSAFLPRIAALKPDVLCLCNFGRDQVVSIQQATEFGLKRTTKLVAPVLLFTARKAGGDAFEGVVGGTSYYWRLEDSVPSAKAFNDKFRAAYNGAVPSDYGALGYAGVRSVLEGVKAAKSLETDKVIAAMEGLKADFYKGPQSFRKCDHQLVQSVLIVESKHKDQKTPDDVFTILATEGPDEKVLRTCEELGHKA
ncbi:ABC transporter substrate-binding protein [Enterovirga sp. CN4-39]|uniref:ABC transporter substrate-binding protein n=1 Tax=Enterovirga sp. CN4-39 TaxID=3400910 RepID=UPI003C1203C0